MGGNLFKLGRLPRARYLEIENEVRTYLDQKLGDGYRIPRYYGDKPDFGDLDIIVCHDFMDAPWDQVRMDIVRELGIERYQATGPVFSTVYREFQVDYFCKGADDFIATYNFLCFNDLGNLLGKMFRRFNLKYGERGLFYVYRGQDSNYKRDILLTRDYRRIFDFLSLDPGPWEAGFADLPSMFRWVIGSPYFSVAPYVERAPTTNRRLRLRKTMREFVAFLEREGITTTYPYHEDRRRYIPTIAAAFPEVELERILAEEDEEGRRRGLLREKFNGHVVRALIPGLDGKELGAFIREIKSAHPDFEDRMLAASTAEVEALILSFHETWRNRQSAARDSGPGASE